MAFIEIRFAQFGPEEKALINTEHVVTVGLTKANYQHHSDYPYVVTIGMRDKRRFENAYKTLDAAQAAYNMLIAALWPTPAFIDLSKS